MRHFTWLRNVAVGGAFTLYLIDSLPTAPGGIGVRVLNTVTKEERPFVGKSYSAIRNELYSFVQPAHNVRSVFVGNDLMLLHDVARIRPANHDIAVLSFGEIRRHVLFSKKNFPARQLAKCKTLLEVFEKVTSALGTTPAKFVQDISHLIPAATSKAADPTVGNTVQRYLQSIFDNPTRKALEQSKIELLRKFCSFDIEGQLATLFRRSANPFAEPNYPSKMCLCRNDQTSVSEIVFSCYNEFQTRTSSILPHGFLDGVNVIVVHEMKKCLPFLWLDREFIRFLERGGICWSTSYAEHLLSGFSVKTCPTADLGNIYNASDLTPTACLHKIFTEQTARAARQMQLCSILARQEALLCTTEMEWNGIHFVANAALIEKTAGQVRDAVVSSLNSLHQYIPSNVSAEAKTSWNWASGQQAARYFFGVQESVMRIETVPPRDLSATALILSFYASSSVDGSVADRAKALLKSWDPQLVLPISNTTHEGLEKKFSIVVACWRGNGNDLQLCFGNPIDGTVEYFVLSSGRQAAISFMQKCAHNVDYLVLVTQERLFESGHILEKEGLIPEGVRVCLCEASSISCGAFGADFADMLSETRSFLGSVVDSVKSIMSSLKDPISGPAKDQLRSCLCRIGKGILDSDGSTVLIKREVQSVSAAAAVDRCFTADEAASLRSSCKTAGGSYSVDEKTLQLFADAGDPVAGLLGDLRASQKLLGTYLDPMNGVVSLIHPKDSCVHQELLHDRTATGRLASQNPNSQNFPKEPQFRKLMDSRFGGEGCLIEADYEQLEVVTLCALSGDKQMTQDLQNHIDFHCKRVTMMRPELKYDEVVRRSKVTKEPEFVALRKRAKIFSFQRQYGAGVQQLVSTTGLSFSQINSLIAAEKKAYPSNEEYCELVRKCATGGAFNSVKGEAFPLPTGTHFVFESRSDSISPTVLRNYPVQGFAGEIVQIMLGKLYRHFLKTHNYENKAFLVNTVHDSVWIDAHQSVVDVAAADTKKILESVSDTIKSIWPQLIIKVPFRVDITAGQNLSELKTWKAKDSH